MKHFFSILFLLFSIPNFAQQKVTADFKTTLSNHLKSISDKDLKGIEATVSDSVTLIFPDGEVLKSKKKFVEFHINWFKDLNWEMKTRILQLREEPQLAYALVEYQLTNYTDAHQIKSRSTTLLLLIFEKQNEVWKLIHDQNTKITM